MDAAHEALRQHGVTSGLDAVTLDGAISDSGVPRGSAYKLWQSDEQTPQDGFRRAVVLDILRTLPASTGLPSTEGVYAEAVESISTLDLDNPDDNAYALRELTRVVTAFNHLRLEDGENWRIYGALRTAAMTRFGDDTEIMDAIREGEEFLINGYADLYGSVADLLGYRLKGDLTLTEFSAVTFALNEGLVHRLSDTFRRGGIERPTGPDGEMREWTLYAIGFEALVHAFWEKRPS